MACEFFFSYTRSNNDPYLKRFFEDLSVEVRTLRGLPEKTVVGFFDQQDIELGEDWDRAIVHALRTCKVMVSIASPGYFKSEYCGKEWALFQQRLGGNLFDDRPAPLLKPVIWVPVKIDELPQAVGAGQLLFKDPSAIQNVRGFRYLLKQIQEQRTVYNDLVETLASEIVTAADQYPLPKLEAEPRLGTVPAAFGRVGLAAPAATTTPVATGPKHVSFIYVAAHPQAFGAARKQEPYLDAGGPDWKPFYPNNTTRVHRFVQSVVAGDELDFTSEAMPFGPNLIARIDEAWRLRQIVVLIVDGWTVHWDSLRSVPMYQEILRQLDGRLDYHWCVLVPWNDDDPDAAPLRDAITSAVRNTFDRHANLAPNPMFYRDGIQSTDALKRALAEVLTRLKEEIKRRAPVDMPIPVGPPKSVVTGPSAGV